MSGAPHGFHWTACHHTSPRALLGGLTGGTLPCLAAAVVIYAAWDMWHWWTVIVPVLVVLAFAAGRRTHRANTWARPPQTGAGWTAPAGTTRRVTVQHQVFVDHEVDVVHTWQVNDPATPRPLTARTTRALPAQQPAALTDWATEPEALTRRQNRSN